MFYVFDVDMTLAESDCEMTPQQADTFRRAMAGKTYFLCSGSQLTKMQEQVPEDIRLNAAGLFPVMGGELWVDGQQIYQREFIWPEGLREELETILAESPYPVRAGDHIQDRTTMICYSIVGKACTREQRLAYNAWDATEGERKRLRQRVMDRFPSLNVTIGGQISIDISELGNDKGQVLPILRERFGADPITFFGDRAYEGGNDWPLAQALTAEAEQTGTPNQVVLVKDPDDTMAKLTELSNKETAA